MILSFSKDEFVDKILAGIKVHTIREDNHNRWRPGMDIQFWRGNPRNTKAKNKPYHFANGKCVDVSEITLELTKKFFIVTPTPMVKPVDGKVFLCGSSIKQLGINDGFDNQNQFNTWFPVRFSGKLIWFEVTKQLI
jgi:hypothetical protein